MDQGGEAGGEHDSFFLSPFPRQRGAAGAEPTGLQSGQFVAATCAATTNRKLVADESAATDSKDWGRLVKRGRYYWFLLAEGHLGSGSEPCWAGPRC